LEETGLFPALPEGAIDPRGLDETRVKKPVVVAVQGACFTIGFELLLAMDIRVASADTRFALLEVKRGIYPTSGGTIRLHREIGWANAMRYLLSGEELRAEEAWRLGLVQEVTEPGRQVERAIELAETIAKQAPLGVKAALLSARRVQVDSERQAIERLAPDLVPILKSDDASEGVKSFVERRDARFQGC
jgi:enoyl-CoA hydratase